MTLLEGVDISYMQGDYTPAGEDFVIINASRANIGLTVGSCYRAQVAGAREAGKHVGHYFFNGNLDPVVCADFFIANLAYEVGDSLWLDVEAEPSTNTAAWDPAQALAFLNQVKTRLGVVPGVYLNKSLMDGMDWSAVVAVGAPLWIASYNPPPPPIRWWPTWTVWQYTSTPIDRNKAQTSLITAFTTPTLLEDDMRIQMIKTGDASGAIGTLNPDGTLDWLTADEFQALTRTGLVEPVHAEGDGTVWGILASRTARLRAQQGGDPVALAKSVSALLVPAVLAGIQANSGLSLTPEQVQAACETAIKDVFAHASQG
ncbi:hypothetical protein ATY41_03395 [Leifsonia xyli subsp. xyli]|uniref:Phage-related lysozyme n=2 Tax=Leifsonia xyli subsp. xyli TaxID=59736 RepID=Q6AH55_LEIXX|nr:glycoside hydrolase family 25 protein [Leifsonia xyli]AAT88140.1 phage-related lysozyme [Leifsonia xyli subsp. xyli str. CTCB07]AAT88290.1 phage-related lysozyme [Leifsonia xyli subsp. xyli str. CTCB07]ODA89731.1 hypothetical protein ATY41_03395 [Leifsonia xyli subsp. xyli]